LELHNTTNREALQECALVVTRNIGHKEDIPGSGQWRMITKDIPGHNECWVCDRHVYSLIFWNELIGIIELRKFSKEDKDFFMTRIHEINPDPDGIEIDKIKCERGCPMIYGEFTNWKPKPMTEIREYCERVNPERKDIFEYCRENHLFTNEKVD